MELHELQHMLDRLKFKTHKTQNDWNQIEFLEEKIFETLDIEVRQSHASESH